jgi:hypothetical protein
MLLWTSGRLPSLVPPLNALVAASYLRPRRTIGRSDHVLTLPMPPVHRETEYAIPVERTAEAMRAIRALIAADGRSVPRPGLGARSARNVAKPLPRSRPRTGVVKTLLITCSNAGIGAAAALQMAAPGVRLVLACRSEAKALPLLRAVERAGAEASFLLLDLSSLRAANLAAEQLMVTDR